MMFAPAQAEVMPSALTTPGSPERSSDCASIAILGAEAIFETGRGQCRFEFPHAPIEPHSFLIYQPIFCAPARAQGRELDHA